MSGLDPFHPPGIFRRMQEMEKFLAPVREFERQMKMLQATTGFPDTFTDQLKNLDIGRSALDHLKDLDIARSAVADLDIAKSSLADFGIAESAFADLDITRSAVEQFKDLDFGRSTAQAFENLGVGAADKINNLTEQFSQAAGMPALDSATSSFSERVREISEAQAAFRPIADMDKLEIRLPEMRTPPIMPVQPKPDLGRKYYEHLVQTVNEFVNELDDDYEVGIRIGDAGIEFRLEEIGYQHPGMLTFRGKTNDGAEVLLIRHFSQSDVTLMKFRRKPENKNPGIGFTRPDSE